MADEWPILEYKGNSIPDYAPLPEAIQSPLSTYLKEKMEERYKAEITKMPWWCCLCGEGGNYEGERPDTYWFAPEDHVCKEINNGS